MLSDLKTQWRKIEHLARFDNPTLRQKTLACIALRGRCMLDDSIRVGDLFELSLIHI